MKKEIKVVMLSTKDITDIVMFSDGSFRLRKPMDDTFIPESNQHIHITSGEALKDGDWYAYKKIMATTDRSLSKTANWNKTEVQGSWECSNCGEWTKLKSDRKCKCKSIPNVSQDFLKAFVESGGREDGWEIEYDRINLGVDTSHGFDDGESYKYKDVLKLDQNNCVIITPVEGKMYSKKDILNSLQEYWDITHGEGYSNKRLINWIEESL